MNADRIEALTVHEFEYYWVRANTKRMEGWSGHQTIHSHEWEGLQKKVVTFLREVENG